LPHLLKLCCELADDRIDAAVVRTAIAKLAAEYRYFLTPGDDVLLKTIDSGQAVAGHDGRAQDLMHRLALLQYNDGGWCRSHPVVRTLEGYRRPERAWNRRICSRSTGTASPTARRLRDQPCERHTQTRRIPAWKAGRETTTRFSLDSLLG
jgi:hypothetical protein